MANMKRFNGFIIKYLWCESIRFKAYNALLFLLHNNGGYLSLRFFRNTAVIPEIRCCRTSMRLSLKECRERSFAK